MDIKSIYIKNFKAFADGHKNLTQNNIIIGDNDSGKSSILEALDIFFNKEKIDSDLIINKHENVELGVLLTGNKFVKKIYSGASHKLSKTDGDKNLLNDMVYLFIPHDNKDVCKVLESLANADLIEKIKEDGTDSKITALAKSTVDNILNSLDNDLIVINNDAKNETKLLSNPTMKWETAIKYNVSSNGIPIESRGSGYQKNLIYALLTNGKNYKNVILGIDEIENSFSIANVKTLINKIKTKFAQTIITTHSTAVMSCGTDLELKPIITGNIENIAELYSHLGGISQNTIFVLVEGKIDIQWIKTAIRLGGKDESKYLILPCGGHTNIENVHKALQAKHYLCKIIKDGDTGDTKNSLKRKCIELYIPVDSFNKMFSTNLKSLPDNPDDFFKECKKSSDYSRLSNDNIKKCIADCVPFFLKKDNELIEEVMNLIA